MSKKQPEPVSLHREPPARRRIPWPVFLLIPVVLIGAALAWVFQGRIKSFFTPQPTPPPTAALEGGVFYQADFEDPSVAADWEIFDDGTISAAISGGQLVVSVNAFADTGTWSGLSYTFGDFMLDVDAAKLAGPDDNGIIVIFRLRDTRNYNRFDISSDGFYSLSKARNGEYVIVSDFTPSSAIQTGSARNHIRIIARGDTFRFEVNGKRLQFCVPDGSSPHPIPLVENGTLSCLGGALVEEWHDADLTEGKIGLGAQGVVGFDGEITTPAEASVAFDNLIIQHPDFTGQ